MQAKENIHALRLKPGQDLKIALQEYVIHEKIQAGWVVSGIGSLTHYSIRFANQQNNSEGDGFFEIISLSGTLSTRGLHLHMAISDLNGVVIGGHLSEGCCIYTTAEIIIGERPDLIFTRDLDPGTGFNELQIRKKTDE